MDKRLLFTLFIFLLLNCGGSIFVRADSPTSLYQPESKKDVFPPIPGGQMRISLDFKDASLKDVLKIFSQQTKVNFIPSDDVQDKRITVYLEDVPVEYAINSIVLANGLTYERGPDKNIFIVRASGKAKVKTITKIYTLNFVQVAPLAVERTATAGAGSYIGVSTTTAATTGLGTQIPAGITETKGIVDILNELLSPAGKIVVDQRTNSLIITDIPEQFPLIEEMIEKLDTPTPQVFIEAEIIETTLEVSESLGLEYGGTSGQWSATYAGPTRGYSFPYKTKVFKAHGATPVYTFGSMQFSNLSLLLKALTSRTDTRYLARPRVLTLNNETAIIDTTSDAAVGTITISEPQTATTTTTPERMQIGVSLKVTPTVNNLGYITMLIEPSVARTVVSGISSTVLNPIRRSVKSKVMIKDGETVVIGGLIDTQKTDVKRKVPILGGIPIIGALFSSDTKTDTQTEILIFITPHIVRAETTAVRSAKVAGSEEMAKRELELFAEERGRLINEAISSLAKEEINPEDFNSVHKGFESH